MKKDPEEIRNFVVEKLKEKNLSMNSVSLMIGKNAAYLFKYVNHKTPYRLPEIQRKKLAAILEVDEQDLSDININYEPPFITAASAIHDKVAGLLHKFPESVKIDIINATACCGSGNDILTEKPIGIWQMPLIEFKNICTTAPDAVKMIKVTGDSMFPTLSDGDWVLVNTANNFFNSDGLYIIRSTGGLSIKRLQGGLADTITIKSDNKDYDSINANLTDVQIIGRVIYILNARKV